MLAHKAGQSKCVLHSASRMAAPVCIWFELHILCCAGPAKAMEHKQRPISICNASILSMEDGSAYVDVQCRKQCCHGQISSHTTPWFTPVTINISPRQWARLHVYATPTSFHSRPHARATNVLYSSKLPASIDDVLTLLNDMGNGSTHRRNAGTHQPQRAHTPHMPQSGSACVCASAHSQSEGQCGTVMPILLLACILFVRNT